MATKIGKYTFEFENNPSVKNFASITGKKEKDGPLGKEFDKSFDDDYLGEKTWEKAESRLQSEAIKTLLEKSNLKDGDVDLIFSGDLLNQCISSSYGIRGYQIPFLGQYGACSTMAQTIIMAANAIESGIAKNCIAVTSSHFCSAERQFRTPLEYGGQRPKSAQWTATASGSLLINNEKSNRIKIVRATVGKIVDMGVKDMANMGAVMAPAAADTICNFLNDTKTSPNDYDLILTGDLGLVGSEILQELLKKNGFDLKIQKNNERDFNYNDCGLMLYHIYEQDVHSGGSGCGCSASVLCSTILKKLSSHELTNVVFVATGALMSPTSTQQGETIPAIAHLVNFRI